MAVPDDVWIEWAPTAGVNAVPSWTPLAYPLKLVSYRRGIKRAAQRVEAGEALIVFDNKSRDLDPMNRQSPLWPNVGPRRPIRIRMRHRGRVRTLWTGLTTSIKPNWSLNAAVVTISARDRYGLYADQPAPVSGFRLAVAATRPRWWWPLDEQGGDFAYNRGSESGLYGVHDQVDLKGESLTPYGPGESSAGYGKADQSRTATFSTKLNPPFTIGFMMKANEKIGSQVVLFSQGGTSSVSPDYDVGFLIASDFGNFAVSDGVNATVNQIGFIGGIVGGAPHLIYCRYGPSGMNVRVDNVQTDGTYSGQVPRSGPVVLGNNVAQTKGFKGRLSHVQVWDRYLSNTELTTLALAHAAPRDNDSPAARIDWLLDQAGEGADRNLLEAGREALGPYIGVPHTLDAIARAAATDGGIFLMDADGRPTFFARNHQGRSGGVYSTNPVGDERGLQDLVPNVDEDGFFTAATTKVSTPWPITINHRHPNADIYGDLTWDADTEYRTPEAATEGARRVVGDAVPIPHLESADHYATEDTINEALALDVWDGLTVLGYPPDEAGRGPFIEWGSTEPFWDAPDRGWGGPEPLRQVSRVLEAETVIDYSERTTHRVWTLEPGGAATQVLSADSQSFEGSVGGWTAGANTTLARSTTAPISGAASGSLVAAAAGDVSASVTSATTGSRGTFAEASLKPAGAPRSVRLRLEWLNAAGSILASLSGPSVVESATDAVPAFVHGVGPDTAASVRLVAVVTGAAAGEEHRLDDARLWISADVVR